MWKKSPNMTFSWVVAEEVTTILETIHTLQRSWRPSPSIKNASLDRKRQESLKVLWTISMTRKMVDFLNLTKIPIGGLWCLTRRLGPKLVRRFEIRIHPRHVPKSEKSMDVKGTRWVIVLVNDTELEIDRSRTCSLFYSLK